jgi:hypothetical protein
MHHYRQALLRMRQGESDRDIAAARLMGRRKAGHWRALAKARGWLDPQVPLPDDQAVCDALAPPKRASSTVSSLEAHRAKVASWVEQGVSGTAIHQALVRQHGWSGSYSGVRRMVAAIRAALPPEPTCRLEFAPGEAAQVDFGAGPMMAHPSGQMRRTWAFVMTLAHSRHQYLEFVWDQTVATWLGCHRRALEWFNGLPQRIVIDNAKCAITRACAQDPVVQRAYAECAEGYGFKIDPCPPPTIRRRRASSRPGSSTSRPTSCLCASFAVWPTSTPRHASGSCRQRASASMAPHASSPWPCSCRKTPCPAYGKVNKTLNKTEVKA